MARRRTSQRGCKASPSQTRWSSLKARGQLLGNLFELEDLGAKDLKGIARPVRAWAALRASSVESRFEALHTAGLTALVGREEELELLLRRWSRAKRGEGQVVLLSGEAGIGKSRLTASLMERLVSEPHTRLRYFCSPQHTDSALYPVIGQMERAAGSSSNGRLTRSRPCRPRRICVAKRSSFKSLSRTLWRSRATLWMARSTTTGRSRFTILPNTVRLRRVLAGMSGWPSCRLVRRVCGILGYPAASRNDAERAVKNARETGQATTLMYALYHAGFNHTCCGNYAAANAQVDELIALADERGAPYWKAIGTALRGWLFALTGKASDAVRAITSGITSLRSTGATLYEPWHLSAFGNGLCGTWPA